MPLDQWSLGAGGVLSLRWSAGEALPMRETRRPGADVSDLPSEVQAACADLWTPGYVADWLAEYDPPPTAVPLDAYAAAKRWQVETGGIVVSGASIDTTRESQAMITGAHAYAQANPEATISFKAAGGFVTLDAATMIAVASAVGQHVQACFAREAAVVAAITAGDVTTTAEIDAAFTDVAAPWPPAP